MLKKLTARSIRSTQVSLSLGNGDLLSLCILSYSLFVERICCVYFLHALLELLFCYCLLRKYIIRNIVVPSYGFTVFGKRIVT